MNVLILFNFPVKEEESAAAKPDLEEDLVIKEPDVSLDTIMFSYIQKLW